MAFAIDLCGPSLAATVPCVPSLAATPTHTQTRAPWMLQTLWMTLLQSMSSLMI